MTGVAERLSAALADRYRVERELGLGGMATVYLAEDLKHHRKVAVKVLRPELAATLGPDRFLREITIAASLQHPHILPLYDSGQADGFLYYVMPFVDGPSLRQKLLREGELPIPEAVRILRDLADAMAYAHSQGVVHRDIKPENVMLAGRHALVTDFGVAKAVSEATGRHAATTAGIAVGTPTYMAPEQAAADPHTDHRADLYAFGVLAYELLTGRPPFTGPTPQAVLAAHVTMAAEPIMSHRASLPPKLAALVMRCLEKKPADRWQNADELIPELEAVLTPSAGTTPTRTVPAAGRRSRTVLGWLALGAIALLGLGGLVWWRGRGGTLAPGTAVPPAAHANRSVAVLPLVNLSGNPNDDYFADGLTEELMGALGKVPGLRVAGRTSVFTFKGRNADTKEVAQRLGVETVLSGSAQRVGDRVRLRMQLVNARDGLALWSESYDREFKDVFAVQDEVTQAIVGALRLTLGGEQLAASRAGGTKNPAAHDLYLRGLAFFNTFSEDGLGRAIELFHRAQTLDSSYAQAYAGEALAWGWLADSYRPPRDVMERARRAAERAIQLDSLLAEAHAAFGSVLGESWRFADAAREARRAVALDPNSTLVLENVIWLLDADPSTREETIALADRAVASDPLSAVASFWREQALLVNRRYDDVLVQHRRTLSLDPRFYAFDDLAALAYRAKNELAQSLAEYATPHAAGSGQPLPGKAVTLARLGRVTEARALLDSLVRSRRDRYLRADAIAAVYANLGEPNRAFEWLNVAVEDRSGSLGNLPYWPDFDPIRRDPRFATLMKKIGLP